MYIMYVDESGDPGENTLASQKFILSGLIVYQDDWDKYLNRLKSFRKSIKNKYNLNQRTEIHSSELIRINKIEEYKRISKSDRINIIRDYCNEIPKIFDTALIVNICIDKASFAGRDIFELAWGRLLQRYDTFLKKMGKDKGVAICDGVDSIKLMNLHRKMRIYNPVPSHFSGYYSAPVDSIIEDILSRHSHHSYFIQTVDVIAFSLFRQEVVKGSLRKFNMELQFSKLDSILLKKASSADAQGVVRQ